MYVGKYYGSFHQVIFTLSNLILAAMVIRQADKDDVVNGVRIPGGTPVFIAAGVVNFDQRTWGEDAEQFNPDRWDSLPQTISNYSFMTFLQGIPLMNIFDIGTRSCIGRKFAETEMKCLLAVLIGKFTFEEVVPGRKVEKEALITVRPKGGMPLHVRLVNP
jgi:cytochrome P450